MKKNTTRIKVVGVGGAGSNALTRIAGTSPQGVESIAVNTDAQDLQKVEADLKVRIGRKLTQGLGVGMNPEMGRLAAEENKEEIFRALSGADIVFVVAGFGGGTGTGAAPVVAEIAKKEKILTIVIVTTPFSFEGLPRQLIAEKGLENLRNCSDSLLVIPNNKILQVLNEETTVKEAFWAADEIFREAVLGISDLLLVPGIINIDLADVRAVMKNSGRALFGVGKGEGEKRVEMAVEKAINSPFLDVSIRGAKGVLFNISGSENLTFNEVQTAAQMITKNVNSQAKVIFGAVRDKNLQKNELKIIVIASGL